MAKANERTCIVCGKKYQYCPRCEQYSMLPKWMSIYHDANCREIFRTATEYNAGHLSDDEARERFSKCDLSDKEHFAESIVQIISRLFPPKGYLSPGESLRLSEEDIQYIRSLNGPDDERRKPRNRGKRRELPVYEETSSVDSNDLFPQD